MEETVRSKQFDVYQTLTHNLSWNNLTIKYGSGYENLTIIIEQFHTNNINLTANSNHLKRKSKQTQFCKNFGRMVQFPSNKILNFTNRGGQK